MRLLSHKTINKNGRVYDVEVNVNQIEGLTKRQSETIVAAIRLNRPFRTKDLAPYISPVMFWRGIAYRKRGDSNVWSHSEDTLRGMGIDDIERYDFRRRAVLTTSSRLASIEKTGKWITRRIDSDRVMWWEIVFPKQISCQDPNHSCLWGGHPHVQVRGVCQTAA